MGGDRMEEAEPRRQEGGGEVVLAGQGAAGVGEPEPKPASADRGGGGMAEQAVNWDEVIRELETGDLTPAQVAEKYGFGRQRGFSRMLKAAPEGIRPKLRQAKLRGEKRRIREGKTDPSRRKTRRKESEETKELEPTTQEEAETKAEEIAKTVVKEKREEPEEEKPESIAKPSTRTWVWLAVAAAGAFLFYLAWRNRLRMQRAQRFIDRAMRENPEERRPPETPRGFWDEYRL